MSNNIRCLIWRISASCRVRHWHGRGIHSPTAYKFTREVFGQRRNLPQHGIIFQSLREHGFDSSSSSMLQAIYRHFACGSCYIDGIEITGKYDSSAPVMYVIPATQNNTKTDIIVAESEKENSVICLLTPRCTKEWYNTCLTITRHHEGMSIDCRNMIVLLNFRRINRQHIKL